MTALGTVSQTVRMQAMAVADESRTVPIELKAVDRRYPLYGQLTLEDGRAVGAPSSDMVWIGPALRDRIQVDRGDRLRFGTAWFTVGGIIKDEPDRLGEGFTLGPVAILSMEGISRTGLIQPGSLYESKYRVRTKQSSLDQSADAFKAAFPEGGWGTRTRERASPATARFIDRMGQFLILVGLAALVIAGIGVGNGVTSYLGARRASIATLKVLGATSATIAHIYVLQVAAVSCLGIVLGLGAGVAAVPLIVAVAGDVLPVAPRFSVFWMPLAVAAAYGALIALTFTAPPLVRAGYVPASGLLRGVSDARRPPLLRTMPWIAAGAIGIIALALATAEQPWLSASFLGAVAAVLLLLSLFGWLVRQLAARAPRPRQALFRLAVASLHRPGSRTVTLVVALGLGLTLFVLLAAIRTSIDGNIRMTVPERAPALFALDVPVARAGEFETAVRRIEPAARVQMVPTMRGTITGYAGTRVADLQEIPEGAWAIRGERGLTYSEEIPPGSEVVAGRWWPKDYSGPPLVSVDEDLGRALDLKIGDPITFTLLGVERSARIASFRKVKWETLGFNFVLVFSPNAIADAPHNLAATIDMPPGRESEVMRALLPAFPSVSVVEVGGVLNQIQTIVSQMATAISVASSAAILAGIAVLIGAMAAAREARTYDSVILKTLGATRAQILGVQGIEFFILSLAVSLLSLALGLGAGWYVVTQVFDFKWLPDMAAVLATLAAGTGITLLIGLGGSLPILAVRPATALRQL